LDGIPADGGVEVAVRAGDEMGAEVRRITGGTVAAFPPKLLTLPGVLMGIDGESKPLADEINEEACSGERNVVVGGRVIVVEGEVEERTCPGVNDVPLLPRVLLLPPSPGIVVGKGKLVLPSDVQLFAISV